MQLKDHYKTLGVSPSSGQPEIKKAYRALAVRYHPDKNPGSALCEAQFKELNEAYAVLSVAAKRSAYDDERWLSGMGHKTRYNEAVTPAWLLNVCVELNTSLATMDTFRMSQATLQAYLLLILADAHLGVLQREGDTKVNNAVIREIVKATAKLKVQYLGEVMDKLQVIAGSDVHAQQQINNYAAKRYRQERKEHMFPYVVLAVTLALCLFMYFYAGAK